MIAYALKIRKALKVAPDSRVLIEMESGKLDEHGTLVKLWVEFPQGRIDELKDGNFAWLNELKDSTIPGILFNRTNWRRYRLCLDDVAYIDGGIRLHYFLKPSKAALAKGVVA